MTFLRLLMTGGCLLTLLSTAATNASCPQAGEAFIAIIIDDLGYSAKRGEAVTALPAPITLSLLPNAPHAKKLAAMGRAWGKEIMVHLPMSSVHSTDSEPLELSDALPLNEFDRRLNAALDSIPGASGVNNHQGSALTTNRAAMNRLMQAIKGRDWFFIDSRTTAKSVAADAARDAGLRYASRTLFLDHERGRQAVAERLIYAIYLARKVGTAIAIGHPYPETIAVLRDALLSLPDDLTVVPASAIASCPEAQSRISIPFDAR